MKKLKRYILNIFLVELIHRTNEIDFQNKTLCDWLAYWNVQCSNCRVRRIEHWKKGCDRYGIFK